MPKDDRLGVLRAEIEAAQRALAELDGETRSSYPAELKFMEDVLGFAALVLERSDAELLSDQIFASIQAAAQNVSGNPAAALPNAQAGAWGDAILQAVTRLPAARDRDLEQAAKRAAANLQRAAANRLKALLRDITNASTQVEELRGDIETRSTEFGERIEARSAELETKIAELESTVASQREALDQLMTRHTSEFSEAQGQRASEFQEQSAATRTQLRELTEEAQQDISREVGEIRRMQEESAQLVGAIAVTGTAERYGIEADTQQSIADRLRLTTIVLALAAVGMAVWAAVHPNQSGGAIAAKLGVSLVLGGLAAYTARQSGRHRAREETARSLQLDLTAFGPFIESLQDEQQEEERVIMTRRTFGRTAVAKPLEEEFGPGPFSFLMRRKQKELE
jgi:uncharacterized coiled-coil protein SlyX